MIFSVLQVPTESASIVATAVSRIVKTAAASIVAYATSMMMTTPSSNLVASPGPMIVATVFAVTTWVAGPEKRGDGAFGDAGFSNAGVGEALLSTWRS